MPHPLPPGGHPVEKMKTRGVQRKTMLLGPLRLMIHRRFSSPSVVFNAGAAVVGLSLRVGRTSICRARRPVASSLARLYRRVAPSLCRVVQYRRVAPSFCRVVQYEVKIQYLLRGCSSGVHSKYSNLDVNNATGRLPKLETSKKKNETRNFYLMIHTGPFVE